MRRRADPGHEPSSGHNPPQAHKSDHYQATFNDRHKGVEGRVRAAMELAGLTHAPMA